MICFGSVWQECFALAIHFLGKWPVANLPKNDNATNSEIDRGVYRKKCMHICASIVLFK